MASNLQDEDGNNAVAILGEKRSDKRGQWHEFWGSTATAGALKLPEGFARRGVAGRL
jgi:hypothetical protein